MGKEQYAFGVKSAVEKVTNGVQADQLSSDDRIVATIDMKNAFETMSRGVTNIAHILYGKPTPLLWEDSSGTTHTLFADTGMN